MNLALIHDYLIQDGGAERVLKAFHDIWPEAPLFVLLHDEKKMRGESFGSGVRTSFLQRLPFARTKYKWMMPLMPMATEQYDLREFDTVLSSTSAFAKGVITRPDATHVCYCHTPTRYLWSDAHTYVNEIGLPGPVKKLVPFMLSRIRIWDRLAAERPDRFVANSETVRRRIAKYYQRESDVIPPPVDTDMFSISPRIGNYYVAGGRLVAYKRFDVIVRAFNKLGIPLKIFGEGPELQSLRRGASHTIEFTGKIDDAAKAELYSKAIAYLHPQEEDFGITAVEAMAAGRPVIAYRKGGATETVIEGLTGEFLDDQTWEELGNSVIRFKPENYHPIAIRTHAKKYDVERFKERMKAYVEGAAAKNTDAAQTRRQREFTR